MGHEEIIHRDSEHEGCPLCRANNEILRLCRELDRVEAEKLEIQLDCDDLRDEVVAVKEDLWASKHLEDLDIEKLKELAEEINTLKTLSALREERARRYTVEEVTDWLSEYHGKYQEVPMTEWVRARRALKEKP